MLRQQRTKPGKEQPNLSLADYVAPAQSGLADYIGLFALTAGIGARQLAKKYEDDLDDYHAILTKALADRLAEATAEMLHERARLAWGFGQGENLSKEDLIAERYRGIRPAPGYPACPDHSEKEKLFDLLQAEDNAGVSLTESFAMSPAASICGFYFGHPKAHYFTVGRIGRDQMEEYALRKGTPIEAIESWLQR